MRSLPVCIIAVLTLCAAAPVGADTRDAAAADALFREAREAIKAGNFATACPKLAESQRLDPAAGTLLNLAECEEKLGKFASASQHAHEALDQLPAGDERAPLARRVLASVEKKVPRLTIMIAPGVPAGAVVRRDGVELGPASLGTPLPADPGTHEVVVTAPTRRDASFTVTLRAGEAKQMTVEAGEMLPEPASAASPPASTQVAAERRPEEGRPAGSSWPSGYLVGGVGLAVAAVGGFALIHAHSLKSSSDQTYQEGGDGHPEYASAETWQAAGFVGLFAGGAATVAGAVIVATTGRPAGGTARMRVAPVVDARAGGIVVGGGW